MSIVERIYQYIEKNNISAYAFEKKVGLSNGYLHNRKEGLRGVGSEILERIYRSFPDLNLIWLVTGDGEMEISPHESDEKMQAQSASPYASPNKKNYEKTHDGTMINNANEFVEILKTQIEVLKAGNADKDKIIALLEQQLNNGK